MILYHGSNVAITDIDLSKCHPFKDFGKGFYLTSLKEQAIKMANRVAKIYGQSPTVTMFDFDDKIDNHDLKILKFNQPDKVWAEFVINNRNRHFQNIHDLNCNTDNKYDIVIGPVANDDLALLFRQFTRGYMSIETLLEQMKYKKLTNQYSFHTDKSIGLLNRIGVCNEYTGTIN